MKPGGEDTTVTATGSGATATEKAPADGTAADDTVADGPEAGGAARPSWRAPGGFPWPPVLIVGVLFTLFTGVLFWRLYGPTFDGPAVITDQTFVTRANDVCRRRLPGLRPKVLDKETNVPPRAAADGARKAAGELDKVRAELAALEVAGDQRPAVDGWLGEWRRYIDSGNAYADEMGAGRIEAGYRVAAEGQKHQLAADRFSRANGMNECVFAAGQKLPTRRGL